MAGSNSRTGRVGRSPGQGGAAPLRLAWFTLSGLECADCAALLQRALASLPGVFEAEVVFTTARLKVVFDPGALSEERIQSVVAEMGYGTKRERGQTEGLRAEYVLSGLDCADCAVHVEEAVGALSGVREARVNFGAATLEVVFEAGAARPDVARTVADLGYDAILRESRSGEAEGRRGLGTTWKTRRKTIATIAAVAGFGIGLVAERFYPALALPFFALAVVSGGYYMARAAWVGLRTSRGLDMNFLMTVAVLGAIFLGKWEEAAEVVCLFAAGNALAASTMDRTRAALRGLLSLAPPMATVQEGDRAFRRPVQEVAVGSLVLVRPGERIPLDGVVVSGQSTADESAISGESLPVAKGPGDPVFAGSMNGRGALQVRVLQRAEDGALARIVHMVEEAQARRAPIQQVVDRFARHYTPAVLGLAALLAVGPAILGLHDPLSWVYTALTLLVVACPCALVVSAPVAVASAIASASRHGLLIKGGAFLEALGTVDAIAFDKTGTLTAGRPEVTDFLATDGYRPSELMAIAAALEHRSEHPLAEAILRKHHALGQPNAGEGGNVGCEGECRGEQGGSSGCEEKCRGEEGGASRPVGEGRDGSGRRGPEDGIGETWRRAVVVVEGFQAFPGRGVGGRVEGRQIYVGNPPFMAERGIPVGEAEGTLETWRLQGKTPILVGEPGRLLGMMAIADAPREEAPAALEALRRAGVRHIVVLTGDHRSVAEPIARHLGADEVLADLMPDDKVKAIQGLLARYGRVAMVGDGINDAPALATSTVGVAMGVRGTDAALETADVVLMHDDLRLLAPAIRLGREAMAIIRQNIAFSIAVKALLVALAIPHVLTLGMAVLGDVGTTLLVILNGMRLLRAKAWHHA